MASAADVTNHDSSPELRQQIGEPVEFVKTSVRVGWPHDAVSSPTSTLRLLLRIHYNAALAQASIRLQLRPISLKKGDPRQPFHLFVPLGRVDRLSLADTEHSTARYRLDLALTEPLDLVGPPDYNPEAGWPGGTNMTKKLLSLANALRFSLFVPRSAVLKAPLLDFCAAASQRVLSPLAFLYDTTTLYRGTGGRLYVRPTTIAPSSTASPTIIPQTAAPSPQSDASTVPVETPPGYRDSPPLPEYSADAPPRSEDVASPVAANGEAVHVVAAAVPGGSHVETQHQRTNKDVKTAPNVRVHGKGKRSSSCDPESPPSPKRRCGEVAPSLLLDRDALLLSMGGESSADVEPSLRTLIRLITAQSEAQMIQNREQKQAIQDLRAEVSNLTKQNAALTAQVTAMQAHQDAVEQQAVDKRPRSDTSNSPSGGPRKLPRMSLSPPPLNFINDRLDTLQSHLMSVFEEPLRVSAHQTRRMKNKLSQIHSELEEYLADQDSVIFEMNQWEDTILELKDTVDKMSESLQDAEMRLNDLQGHALMEAAMEAAMESSENLQDWVKDYVEESVGQLLDDAVASVFRIHFADVTAAVSLFQGVVQQVTGSGKVRAGIMSKADDDAPSPSRRGSGQHTTTTTTPQALGPDDSTESDSSTSSPARPAADDAGNKGERPVDTAVPQEKFTTAEKQTAAALETIADASAHLATAMGRIAKACEASYLPAKRWASSSSDESSITFRWPREQES